MEINVLGPLEVRQGGEPVDVRGSKRRALLALLALHANEVVRTDRLIDELWGEERPANAQGALQNHVSRLRKDLGADALVTKPWGYVLRAAPEAIDLNRFERLVAEARPLAARQRSEKLAEALALWRGPALADLGHEAALAGEIDRLEELRLSVLEERVDADLELGEHRHLVHELELLVAQHPLRERLRGQLIMALYRAGRQAEALETYRETRRVLVEELGIEPSPELRELERAILRQDPLLATPVATVADAMPVSARPGRWRWPRSPLVLGGIVLLAAAGAMAAILATRGSPRVGPSPAAAAPRSSPAPSTRTRAARRSVRTTAKPKAKPKPRPTPRRRARPTSPAVAKTPAQPAPQPQSATTTAPATPPAKPPTTAKTATTPKRPATPVAKPPTRTTTTPESIWWLADDFSDPGFDYGFWHLATHGTGVTATEQNGRLELSIAADVGWDPSDNGVDTHYGTQCLLTGDFDASVEYELLDWPDTDGMFLDFGAYIRNGRDTEWAFIGRGGKTANGGATELYGSEVRSSKHWPQTADRAGAFRLKREHGVLTTYYRYHEQWVAVSSGYARGAANLVLGFATNADTFGHQPARAAFDLFSANAETVNCAGFPLPPRKPKA